FITGATVFVHASCAAPQGDLLEGIRLRCQFGSDFRSAAVPYGRELAHQRFVVRLGPVQVGAQFAHRVFARAQLGFDEVAIPTPAGRKKAKGKRQNEKSEKKRAKGKRDSASCPHFLFPFSFCLVRKPAEVVSDWRGHAPARDPRHRIPELPWPT